MAALTFNGQAQQTLPVVTYDGETLVKDENYTVTYSGDCINAGTYTVTVTGVGRYTGTLMTSLKINPFDISADGAINVAGINAFYAKTGSEVHPTPTVTCATNNVTLVAGTDYTLAYSDGCTAPGNYTVTLTGQGNYKGSKVLNFTILDAYDITVHNGSATHNHVPVHGYYANYFQKSEFVMPAAELTAMSGKSITSMQFYLSQKASEVWNATFQVFMKEIDATTLSSYQGTDGATIVYEGRLDATQDVMTINFTTPYAYQGDNFLIGIYVTTKDNNNSLNTSFYGKPVSGTSIGGYSSNSLGAVTLTQYNFLPKTTFWYETPLTLADNATDNNATIDSNNNQTVNVKLDGRTLYQDGDWNTICLPFNVTLANSPLAGADARALSSASLDDAGVLTLNFTNEGEVTTLTAGTPYIIKWNPDLVIKTESDWETFASNVTNGTESYSGKVVRLCADIAITTMAGDYDHPFQGTFDGNGHKLTVTLSNDGESGTSDQNYGVAPFRFTSGASIGAFRAYFEITDGSAVRAFNLNFGEDEVQGITTTDFSDSTDKTDGWYTLDGVKLDKAPNRKGLYIKNGKKVVVK